MVFMPTNVQQYGTNSLNSLDRIKKGMKSLFTDMARLQMSGDASQFTDNSQHYEMLLQSLRFGLLSQYQMLLKLEYGDSDGPTVMNSFVDDCNNLKEARS